MRFILTFALTSLVFASTLYGLILAVDPYNKFGFNFFGFETKAVDFARENKFNQIKPNNGNYVSDIMISHFCTIKNDGNRPPKPNSIKEKHTQLS